MSDAEAKAEDPKKRTAEAKEKATAGAEPRGAADQFGAILTKGLDLAEASLSLGLTVINRVGVAAQHELFDKIAVKAHPPGPGEPDGHPGPGGQAEPAARPGAPDIGAPEESAYCITNGTPLAPGSGVKVAFSINNNSVQAPKKVSLRVEGFGGETEGTRIEGERFTVKPARKTIAPMDFEKFVLQGAVPPEVPPDVYCGWIVVSSGSEFRIPVRLVVET